MNIDRFIEEFNFKAAFSPFRVILRAGICSLFFYISSNFNGMEQLMTRFDLASASVLAFILATFWIGYSEPKMR